MLESLTIDGVRGIDHLHLEGLSLVNVIAGDNGAGKTTILEATVLLFGGSANELRRAQTSRGIPGTRTTRLSYFGLNESLFFNYKNYGTATIRGRWSGQDWKTQFYASAQSSLIEDFDERPHGEENSERLVLQADTTINDERFSVDRTLQEVRGQMLTTTDRRPGQEDANTLGDLRLSANRRALDEIVEALRTINRDVQDVEFIQSSAGTGFYVRLPGIFVPLGALGGGANALFRYLLALQKVAGGVLAIDEVEGGFHYSRVETVFKALLVAARLTNTQIFCTTHSKEVLAALVNAAAETPENDLSVISTYRDQNDRVAAQVLRERDALNSLEHGYELR